MSIADQLTDAQRERVEGILSSLTWQEHLNRVQIGSLFDADDARAAAASGIGSLFWAGSAEAAGEPDPELTVLDDQAPSASPSRAATPSPPQGTPTSSSSPSPSPAGSPARSPVAPASDCPGTRWPSSTPSSPWEPRWPSS